MKNSLHIIILLALVISCHPKTKSQKKASDVESNTSKIIKAADTIPRVTGIGGIFFKSDNPEAIKQWYGDNLGLVIDPYGSPFEFRNAHNPEEKNYLRWSPYTNETDYFEPSEKPFMINYRVQNIEGLVKKLKANGATVLDEITAYDYGKFVHLIDPEGNKIELWEPIDSFLTEMGGATTK